MKILPKFSVFIAILVSFQLSCQNQNSPDNPEFSGIGFFEGINENKEFYFYTEYYAQFHYNESDSTFYRESYSLCEADLETATDTNRFEISGFFKKIEDNNDCIEISNIQPHCMINYSVDSNRDPVLDGEWFLVGIQENNEINFTPCKTRRIPYLIFYQDDNAPDSVFNVFGGVTGNVLQTRTATFSNSGNFKGEFTLGLRGSDSPEYDQYFVETLNSSSTFSIDHNILTISDTLNNREVILQKGSDWTPN